METIQELIPLAKEVMAQKPSRKLVKLYVLGSVLAFFSVVLGLVETVCSPFSAASRLRDEEAALASLQLVREQEALREQARQALLEKGRKQEAVPFSRALSNRQHAS
ncbi:G0/G1 switch protein 2 [Tamandua tetradactyla]|uniref:G0/G1 switch protein 2 n=1 Tax=Tamandua tetradactyla TaxID=48850 RepID=UPI004053E2F3